MRTLIIEDEKANLRYLKSLLSELDSDVEVVASLDSVAGSVEWLESHEAPDLIFLDIHLADGSAFEIFERVEVNSAVIFTTSYDEYAIKAFKVNSVDYLLKPISETELRSAIEKYKRLKTPLLKDNGQITGVVKSMREERVGRSYILVPQGGSKLVPLSVDEIEFFCIEDGVVSVFTSANVRYNLPHTLDELSDMVDMSKFYRVNRQFLITRKAVLDMELWFGSRLSVNLRLAPEKRIIVSKPRVSEFKQWFLGV